MLYTLFSNSFELLRASLMENIKSERGTRLANPETAVLSGTDIIAPNEAIRDDLSRTLADSETGICTGLNFKTMGQWLTPYCGELLGSQERTEAFEWLVWSILGRSDFLQQPDCTRIRSYLNGKNDAERMRLARRIVAVFTMYVSYRLDWVLSWMGVPEKELGIINGNRLARERALLETNPDTAWQRALFRAIAASGWEGAQRLAQIPQRYRYLFEQRQSIAPSSALHIILPDTLPPLSLPFLQLIAVSSDVFLYLLNPCREYWFESLPADLFDWKSRHEGAVLSYLRRNAAAQRALIERVWHFSADPETGSGLYEDDLEGAPTPESTYPRNFIAPAQLDTSNLIGLQAHTITGQSLDMIHVNPGTDTLLHALQHALITNDVSALADESSLADGSIQFVKAPGPMREIEGLVDWITELMIQSRHGKHPIHPEDILVVTPDINATAPLIATVMGNRPAESSLAWHIAGRTELDVNASAQAVIAAGRFLASRADIDALESLIAFPIIAQCWGVDELDPGLIRRWLVAAGFRRGINLKHVQHLVAQELAQSDGHDHDGTLAAALERLTIGRLLPQSESEFYGVSAIRGTELASFESTQTHSQTADFILAFGSTLEALYETMPVTASVDACRAHALEVIARLFPNGERDPGIAALIRHIESVAQTAQDVTQQQTMSLDVFWQSVQTRLSTSRTMARASGRITFAGMDDFRGIPYRVIAIIGINDGPSFPGSNRFEEFDLTQTVGSDAQGHPTSARRRGDRDSRSNNRNVFFDLVMSARDHLYISYDMGRKANIENNPSVVVQDLRQLIARGLRDPARISLLTQALPAQNFSEANFTRQCAPLQSHNAMLADAIEHARQSNYLGAVPRFTDKALATPQQVVKRRLHQDELMAFLKGPDAWTLRYLNIERSQSSSVPESVIHVNEASALVASLVRKSTLSAFECGKPLADIIHTLSLDTRLGAAPLRQSLAEKIAHEIEVLYELQRETIANLQTVTLSKKLVPLQNDFFSAIELSETKLYINEGINTLIVIALTSAMEDRAKLQALLLNASGVQTRLVLICPPKEKRTDTTFRFDAPQYQTALKMVQAYADILSTQMANTPAYAEREYHSFGGDKPAQMHNPIWRGTEYSRAASAREELDKAQQDFWKTLQLDTKPKRKTKSQGNDAKPAAASPQDNALQRFLTAADLIIKGRF